MKNLILTALIGFGAFAVFGGGSAMEMAGKTLELADETGIAGFVQFGAPAYLTGDFADSAKPEKTAIGTRSLNGTAATSTKRARLSKAMQSKRFSGCLTASGSSS